MGLAGVITEVMFVVAGIAGVLSVAWVAASAMLGLSLITFATGSMAPTMPTGTLAVVREIPAADIEVGQVVMLQRSADSLPITHRVISTEAGTGTGERMVRMQGDANPVADVTPYSVTSGKLVLVSVPGLAAVAGVVTSPLALVASTVVVAGLVLCAFWPRATRGHAAVESSTASATPAP